MTTVSDAELVARTGEGDREAFADLVERYRKPVTRYLARLLASSDQADDLAQETFVRFYEAAPRHLVNGSAAPLLYRIATNLARSHGRWYRRWGLVALPAEGKMPLHGAASPQSEALSSELLEVLRTSLSRVPLRFRAPLLLHEVEGLSYRDIAGVLGCPENTVRSRIARGRAELRRLMAPYMGERAHAR